MSESNGSISGSQFVLGLGLIATKKGDITLNVMHVTQSEFSAVITKSSVECLDHVLGIQKALSTFTVAAVKHGRYLRSKQIIIICNIFYEGSQDGILIKLGDLICKECPKKTSLKQ